MAAQLPQAAAPGPLAGPGKATNDGKIPVTILTGFLGAGKTTLLNYILKARSTHNLNISVIENEFGEVNIDSELVADNLIEKEDLVSLDNGCVCCSLRKDIVKALAEIERRSRHRNKRVDQVILETTGLADPAPVAFTFFANPWIVSRYRLDSIVCVVDTRYVLQHLEEDESSGGINEIAQQLAFSDLILLNKTDLVDERQMELVKSAVRRINQSAKLFECQLNREDHRPPLSLLLDNNSFSVNKALKVDPDFLAEDSGTELSDSSSSGTDSDDDGEGGAEGGAHPAAAAAAAADAAAKAAAAAAAGGAGAAAAAAAADGGVDDIPAQPKAAGVAKAAAAAAAAATTDAEGSSAQQACCGGSSHKQQQAGAAAEAEQAESSQLTSATAVASTGLKRAAPGAHHADAAAGGDSAAHYTKGERRPKRRRKQMHDQSGVGSVGIVARGPLDEYRFNMFMRDLLAEKAKDIFRCKGVLAVHGYGNQRFVFQGVHETICYGPSDKPWGEAEPRINQIVFIGRKLDRKALMEGFRTCVWQKLPEGWVEYHDTTTQQPYYYNPATRQKTWARPVEEDALANTQVTATRLMSMEQPKSCQPSVNKRRSGSLTGNHTANSSSSALSGAGGATGGSPSPAPSALAAAADAAIAAVAAQQQPAVGS